MQVEIVDIELNKAQIDKLTGANFDLEVGILEGATTTDGMPIAQYAYWNEYGVPQRNSDRSVKKNENGGSVWKIPPRPFMRNTAAQFEKSWVARIQRMFRLDRDGSIDRRLPALGAEIASQIVKTIQAGHFAPNAPSTIAAKRRKGRSEPDHPLIDTGQMMDAISYKVEFEE